jgi:diaminopimelate epimerase
MKGQRFVKMQGAGNDFIMILDLENRFDTSPELIASMCAPHRGVGADGLIVVRPSGDADFRMHYFNRDGGEADMCGNGARCAALLAFRSGIAGRSMAFETRSGTVRAEIIGDQVCIGIGDVKKLALSIHLDRAGIDVHFALSGVPHAVCITEKAGECPEADFLRLARSVRHDPAFAPNGANFNLVTVQGDHELIYRTYERGVEAETLACGTGAVAAAVITSHLGPAVVVFEGIYAG